MEQNETTTTTLTLSRGFASIEQYDDEGTQNFSPCPDIYSLGATMYNLLTGIVPIESILRAAKEMLPPTYYNSNISEKTEKAVLKAMELKPADRFQTMKEMLAALNTPSCELSENQYSDEKKPFVGNNFDKHTPITSSHQSEEEDEDRTILALMPPEGSTGTIKNHERGKKKKSNQQKIFSAVAIFICAIACYTLYGYFADDDLAKGFINLQHADTLPASNKIANANIMKFKKLNDFESENDGPKETAVEKKDEKDNSRFVSVISEKTDEKNKHVKTPEKEEEKDFTSYSAQQDTIRREKEYSDYMASAQTNFDEKKYSEADADIRKALKAKYTDKAYELSNKIKEKREETSVEERLAKYRRLTSFGNNLRVVKNGEDKYGAINRSGKEVVVCKYKGTTYYKNGRAFLREDDKYDLYDNNGDLVQEGLPKPSID
jgi:serine/threonine-protein kinase